MAVRNDFSMYQSGLEKNAANFAPLTPLGFLERSAQIYPMRTSIVHLSRRFTWRETYDRCRRMASAMQRRGIRRGDTVAVVGPNIPAVYEAHFGVPMAGAILNTINIRLDAKTIGLFFSHAEARLVIVDYQYVELVSEALKILEASGGGGVQIRPPLVAVIEPERGEEPPLLLMGQTGRSNWGFPGHVRTIGYEALLREGDSGFHWLVPAGEDDAISLNYTSGTTSSPKGVVYSHRGTYLAALSNAVGWGMRRGPVFLWTLPLFHCNGWCFPWTIAALAGTNICMRQVTAKAIFSLIAEHNVTHFCGAPVVLNFMVNAPPEDQLSLPAGKDGGPHGKVEVMTAGAAPPPSVLAAMEGLGFRVTHTYGLTETYGPSVMCEWKEEWDALPLEERAKLKARQGVRYLALEGLEVMDPASMAPVPADGRTQGEVMMRGNIVMKGYLGNEDATRKAFGGGWFHSGDIAVRHPDNYIEIKDRSKDIIISGGENISSIEVEAILHRHPAIMEAAVVARPDDQWGESVCAFLNLKPISKSVAAEEIIQFCQGSMPRFMVPRTVVFQELPKTATGKIQKFVLRKKAEAMGSLPRSTNSEVPSVQSKL